MIFFIFFYLKAMQWYTNNICTAQVLQHTTLERMIKAKVALTCGSGGLWKEPVLHVSCSHRPYIGAVRAEHLTTCGTLDILDIV